MTARFKTTEMLQRSAEVRRMEDILSAGVQDGDRVSETLCNVGFTPEDFFKPERFVGVIG